MKSAKVYTKKIPFYKKKQFLSIVVGLFLIMLMALGTVNLATSPSEDGAVEIQGLSFLQTSSGWQAYSAVGDRILISSHPESLDLDVSYAVDLGALVGYDKVYLSVNPYDTVSNALRDFVLNVPLSNVQTACIEDNELCTDLPLKSCEDASSTTAVVVMQEANETVVLQENNCLTLQGKNLLILTDSLIVDHYGEG